MGARFEDPEVEVFDDALVLFSFVGGLGVQAGGELGVACCGCVSAECVYVYVEVA